MGASTGGAIATVDARIRAIVEEVLQGSPLFLVDVVVRGKSGSQVVEIFVDSDEALDIEDIARVSREVGFLLDTEDVMRGRYSLNVSSPGLDRPLQWPRQYRKNVGRSLRVRYTDASGSATEIEGELKAAGVDGIEVAGPSAEAMHIRYDVILEARVILPW